MAIDEVCGMEVEEKNARFVTTHQGKKFYFCSEDCQARFELNEGIVREGGDDLGGRRGFLGKTIKKIFK